MGIVRKNTANDLRETWKRPFLNTNCWNRKSLHSFRNRERFRASDCVRLQQTTRETERLYDFVVVASQLLRRGLTFGVLRAFQPCADGPRDQKAQPSDNHVLLKPLDSKAMGPLLEEGASIKRQVNRLHKSRPSDLSYMKRQHHLEWYRFWKYGILDGRRRGNCLHSLEVIPRVTCPASTPFVDLLDGSFMGNPSRMEMSHGDTSLLEVVVILATNSHHGLLKAGQLVLKIFKGVVQDV